MCRTDMCCVYLTNIPNLHFQFCVISYNIRVLFILIAKLKLYYKFIKYEYLKILIIYLKCLKENNHKRVDNIP